MVFAEEEEEMGWVEGGEVEGLGSEVAEGDAGWGVWVGYGGGGVGVGDGGGGVGGGGEVEGVVV